MTTPALGQVWAVWRKPPEARDPDHQLSKTEGKKYILYTEIYGTLMFIIKLNNTKTCDSFRRGGLHSCYDNNDQVLCIIIQCFNHNS